MTETKQKSEDDPSSAEEVTSTDDTTDIDQQVEQEGFTQEIEEAQRQASDYHEKLLRMQAEMENLRKRTERDLSNAHKYSIEKFASELLQVKDSLELGLGTSDVDAVKLQEGAELTLKMMASVLKKFTVEEINPCGEAFDPNLHQAMTMQASVEHEPNTVITVVQKGYTLHDRLLRPAMVIVAKAPEEVVDE